MKYNGNIVDGDLPKNEEIAKRKVKRQARYWCFRFKNEADGGGDATSSPPGFKEYVEGLSGFDGWKDFAKTWDIEGHNPFTIYQRDFSVWEEWDAVMRRVAKPLPGLEHLDEVDEEGEKK